MKSFPVCIFAVLISVNPQPSFAQGASAGQIQRSQDILEEQKELAQKITRKVFIKHIVVKGVTLLTENRIKGIISPFQKQWLTEKDIQNITESIKEAYYKEKKCAEGSINAFYKIENEQLEIEIKEISH